MSAGVEETTMDVDQAEEQVSGGQGQGSVTPATTIKSADSNEFLNSRLIECSW